MDGDADALFEAGQALTPIIERNARSPDVLAEICADLCGTLLVGQRSKRGRAAAWEILMSLIWDRIRDYEQSQATLH